MDGLADDATAEVLRRVPPRSLAACRCVCRAWRAAVDERRLLLPHVLPHSVRGIFSNYCDHDRPYLFAPPPGRSGPRIDAAFRSIPDGDRFRWDSVFDHCNGLFLYDNHRSKLYVCNPATRRWALLPPLSRWPRPAQDFLYYTDLYYLAYEPAVSLHYEVFLILQVHENKGHNWQDEDERNRELNSTEWPPPLHRLQVFSSRTKQWEERAFARQGGPAGTIADVLLDPAIPAYWGPQRRYAELWRGALYVHCRGAYVMRLCSSEDKYQVIKTPTNVKENKGIKSCLGRSENGVYYAALKKFNLRVWTLDESRGHMEWVLKHHANLGALCCQIQTMSCNNELVNRPWTISYDDRNEYSDDEDMVVCQKVHSEEEDGEEIEEVERDGKDGVEGMNVDGDDEDLKESQEVDTDEEDETKVKEVDVDEEHELEGKDETKGKEVDGDEEDELEGNEVDSDNESEANDQEYYEWDSEDDDILRIDHETLDIDESNRWQWVSRGIDIIGFHPYEEVMFLSESFNVVAYHLTCSKVQYLGIIKPKDYYGEPTSSLYESYIYTPCLLDSLVEDGH
ncbi:hypothetical protein ACP70R_009150 [Stipagrostis hirtigluma subsp. patula]